MKRGLLLTRPMTINNGKMSVYGDFDSLAVRFALLYMDEICVPTNRLVMFQLSDELRLLESEGLLKRRTPKKELNNNGTIYSHEFGELLAKSYKSCFDELNETSSESWMMHSSVRMALDENNELNNNGELLTLFNSLPKPAEDFPIGDLLEFRLKRSDERAALLNAISSFRLDVLYSENKAEALSRGVLEIEKKIIDLTKALRERKRGLYLTDLSLSFSSTEFLDTFKNVYDESKGVGLDSLQSFLAALGLSVASLLKVSGGYNYKRSSPDSPFLYAAEAKVKFNL